MGNAATAVPLSTGFDMGVVQSVTINEDLGVSGLSPDQCRRACLRSEDCEAVVHARDEVGVCYGKKHVQTSRAEGGCHTEPPFVTEFVGGASRHGPWGKCTILGDPHITTF